MIVISCRVAVPVRVARAAPERVMERREIWRSVRLACPLPSMSSVKSSARSPAARAPAAPESRSSLSLGAVSRYTMGRRVLRLVPGAGPISSWPSSTWERMRERRSGSASTLRASVAPGVITSRPTPETWTRSNPLTGRCWVWRPGPTGEAAVRFGTSPVGPSDRHEADTVAPSTSARSGIRIEPRHAGMAVLLLGSRRSILASCLPFTCPIASPPGLLGAVRLRPREGIRSRAAIVSTALGPEPVSGLGDGLVQGAEHAEVGGHLVGEQAAAPARAERSMEHQELPPAVGFRSLHHGRIEQQERPQPVLLDELEHELVVLPGGGMETVGTARIVGVALVGAGHQGHGAPVEGGGAGDGRAGPDVLGGRQLGAGGDDHDLGSGLAASQ